MLQRPSLPHTPGPQTPTSPPHNPYPHVPPLKPHKSPLLLPRHMQAVTSTSPLRHAQVCWHHPVMGRKTHHDTASTPSQHSMQARLRPQPTMQKPRHLNTVHKSHHANLLHTSPAMMPPTTAPCKSPTTNPPRPHPAPHCRHCSLPIVVLASCLYLFNCNYILLCINLANGVTVTCCELTNHDDNHITNS